MGMGSGIELKGVSMNGKKILDVTMDPERNDARAETIRDYLKFLLRTVWLEGGGFSGKRPFGNSGWEGDLEVALIKANLVKGDVDEDGCINSVDSKEASKLIVKAINALE